ncbi:hypothetical protein CBDKU1_04680 [Clostridium butyricum DKU-01]|nr:hypothetical protein CBDKU1_04680 [Clostridium butyricum DKU-01]
MCLIRIERLSISDNDKKDVIELDYNLKIYTQSRDVFIL